MTAPSSGPAALKHLATALGPGTAVNGVRASEPAVADVHREYPRWEYAQGVSGYCYSEHTATGTQVNGKDPVDLQDQIKAAESRLACGLPATGAPSCGPMGP